MGVASSPAHTYTITHTLTHREIQRRSCVLIYVTDERRIH